MYQKGKRPPKKEGSFVSLTDCYLLVSNLATEKASVSLIYKQPGLKALIDTDDTWHRQQF